MKGLAGGERQHLTDGDRDRAEPEGAQPGQQHRRVEGVVGVTGVWLLANPADERTLAEWGKQAGASARTLARAFLSGTGMTFGQWRRLARLRAALPQLAAGQAVGTVARHVGYQTPSAFVAAFRKETGQTPAACFETQKR